MAQFKVAIVTKLHFYDFVRDPIAGAARNERVVWIWHLISRFNGRSGEIRCVAKSVPPQLQTNAASATWPNVNVGKVRSVDLDAHRSECRLPTLHVDMCAMQHLLQTARTDGCRKRPLAAVAPQRTCCSAVGHCGLLLQAQNLAVVELTECGQS